MAGGINRISPGLSGTVGRMLAVLLAGMALALVQPVSAFSLTVEDRIGLADHFFSEAAYDQAIVEYRTFRYLFPDHARVDYAGFRIALAYFMQSRYDQALERFQQVAVEAEYRQPGQAREALFMVSQCYAMQDRQVPAMDILKHLLATVEEVSIRDRAWYHLGWIRLATAREIDADIIADAAGYFEKISPGNQEAYRLEDMQDRLERARTDRGGPLRSRKSPALAGGLSLFPGAGYLYGGRYQDALVTLLFNGGMMWAAWEAFDNDLPALGTMISFVGVGFYAGSIYGSISAAHKHNRRLSQSFVRDLNRIRVNVLPVDKGRGVMTGVTISF